MKLFALILLLATLVVGDRFYQQQQGPFSAPVVLKSPWQQLASSPSNRDLFYYPNQLSNWVQYVFSEYFSTAPVPVPDPVPSMPDDDDRKNPGYFYSGQHQRSASAKNNYGDQSAENWPAADRIEPKIPFANKQRIPAWNHKFFLLDNEAQTVHALRPFNPLELLSMNLNNPMKPSSSSALTRPIFARQTVRMTVTDVSSVTTTKICIPSNLFSNTTNPTVCPTYNRTRRFVDLEDDLLENDDVSPTTVNQENLVMPTVLISDPLLMRSAVREIESSKYEDLIGGRSELNYYYDDLMPELLTRKDRAMFHRVPSTSTVTVITMETYVVTKAVNPVTSMAGQLVGVLICVPPGIVVCA